MGENILEVGNISVVFEKPIIDNISFSVKEGEIFGIIGQSGAGKTTLLNAIVGYYPTTEGNVIYKKTIEPYKKIEKFRKLIGFSAQNPSFYSELSVLQNLKYFGGLYDIPKEIINYNIKKALNLVELEDEKQKLAKNLSGGMQKRLDIACAIIHRPMLLMLDEPTSDMDFTLRKRMWDLIKKINKTGTTILLASHFLSEIENLCNTIGILLNKKISFIGTPKQLRNIYPKSKALDELLELHIKREAIKED